MGVRAKYLIPLAAAALAWGPAARAEEPAPPAGLSDEDLVKLSQGEAIEIFDERPDKPFDRDTEVRLTGEELAARGAIDLKTALALLPDVTVRDAGRGGFQIDVRGARKGEVSILIDGVLVSDPYYGTFDVSTIPITDIVQIRVATTPQSPIDGPGGPGAVIEVHTRDAIGPQLVIARLSTDTLPSMTVTGTARVALAKHLALRLSGSGLAGARDLELPMNMAIGEARHAATGSMRLEYREGERRVAVDGFIDDRHYVSPPSDVLNTTILLIDRETTARMSIKGDDKIGKLQLQGQAWTDYLARKSRKFTDAGFADQNQLEDLTAMRTGAMMLATRAFAKDFRWVASTTVDHESARVGTVTPAVDAISKGDVTNVEAAADLQYEHGRVRLDGAAGVAAPFGTGASPWPEAKLVAKWWPRKERDLELSLSGGRKGRVPSLRERYDSIVGNPDLAPEISNYGEIRAIENIDKRVRVEVAPFYRYTTGTIRTTTGTMTGQKLINTGNMDVYGIDTLARVQVHPLVELGAAYNFVQAKTANSDEPLDFLPHHRVEGSVRVTASTSWFGLVRVKKITDFQDGGVTVPGYTLVEGNVTANLTKEYTALLRVDDALDVRPQTRAGYHGTGRVISLIVQGTWQ